MSAAGPTGGGGSGGLTEVAHDGTLNGNGTTASPLGVADRGVTAAMLATEAEPNAPSQVLTWIGEALIWQAPPGGSGLALPYSGQADSGDAAFAVINSSATALSGTTTNGNGVFGLSSAAGVAGTSTAGTGVRGTSQSGYGLHGSTQSGVAGVYGTNSRVGGAGVLGADGANDSIDVRGNASNNGSVGIWGQATTATGVYVQSNSGVGVRAIAEKLRYMPKARALAVHPKEEMP